MVEFSPRVREGFYEDDWGRAKLTKLTTISGIIVILILLIAGCEVVTDTARITSSPEGELQPTGLPSVVSSTTADPTSTVSIPTATETRSLSVPTLMATERMSFLFEVMKTNGGCDLPCFMGIVPGETTFDEAKEVFSQTGWSISNIPHTDGGEMIAKSSKDSSIGIYVWLRTVGGIVSHLEISIGGHHYLDYVDYHALVNIMSRFGKPDGIWISIDPGLKISRDEVISFEMLVYYKDENMIFQYGGYASLKGNTYEICPPRPSGSIEGVSPSSGGVLIDIFAEDKQLPPKELIKFRTNPHLHIDEKSQLQVMLNLDMDTFYQDILDRKDTACYFIPENAWPEWSY